MPQEITLRGPEYTFECYGVHEAKRLGLIDSWEKPGTHTPVSTVFEQGEGKLLAEWVERVPDALLIATGRYQITVYRPKSKVLELADEDEEKAEEAPTPRRGSKRLHKSKVGHGNSHVEGIEGIKEDSFDDVANACKKRLYNVAGAASAIVEGKA